VKEEVCASIDFIFFFLIGFRLGFGVDLALFIQQAVSFKSS
jgi:hypothetical protein